MKGTCSARLTLVAGEVPKAVLKNISWEAAKKKIRARDIVLDFNEHWFRFGESTWSTY